MREILFRGKDIDSGEWVQGYYTLYAQTRGLLPCILTGTEYGCVLPKFVIPETVGQHTGLTDKNSNKIFEGDVVKTKFGRLCHVKWRSTGCFCGIDLIPIETKSNAPTEWDLYCSENLEVVGNVHDNPELVGGAE